MAQAPVAPQYNPAKAAHGMVNAEYNPAINSLKQALINLATQGNYDQQQVKGWYGQMSDLMNAQKASQGANQAAAIQNVTGDMGNVAQLFGAQNAQQMQPALGNAVGLIGAEGQSQQDYLSNMLPLLQAQGAQGVQNIDQLVQAQNNNYNDQLTQQQRAKGAAYNADYQQALANQTTQEQNQFALQQAKAMFPAQLHSAKATAAADRANARAAPAYNAARIRAANASAADAAARAAAVGPQAQSVIAKNMAEARKAAMAAKQSGNKANVLAPGSTTYDRIQKNLYRGMTNSTGQVTITNPQRAQHALYAEAVSSGLIDKRGRPLVKGAIKLLNGTLASMYHRDKAWQSGWNWNGRKFVPRKG